MYPNLVRAPGLELNIKQGQSTEFPAYPVMRYGFSAARAYTHALALTRVPSNRLLNGSACDQIALDQGLIPSSNFTGLKLSGQCRAGFRIMRYRHKSGCVPVQPMHDPRPRYFGGSWKVVQESVLDRSIRVPGSRVHDLPGHFVQDYQVFVSINNSQGQVLWLALRGCRSLRPDLDPFATLHRISGAGGFSFYQYAPCPNPILKLSAGKLFEHLRQHDVQALSGQVFRHFPNQRQTIQLPNPTHPKNSYYHRNIEAYIPKC